MLVGACFKVLTDVHVYATDKVVRQPNVAHVRIPPDIVDAFVKVKNPFGQLVELPNLQSGNRLLAVVRARLLYVVLSVLHVWVSVSVCESEQGMVAMRGQEWSGNKRCDSLQKGFIFLSPITSIDSYAHKKKQNAHSSGFAQMPVRS